MKTPKIKDRDLIDLRNRINALKAVAHNPIAWGAIVKLIAPVIIRLAVRKTAGILASKWNKKATPKVRAEVVEKVTDQLTDVLARAIK